MKHHTLETPAGRVVYLNATTQRLSPAQLATALGSMADDDPRWLAVDQLITDEIASAMLDAASRTTTTRDHAAGRLDAMMTLRTQLVTARQSPVAAPERKPR